MTGTSYVLAWVALLFMIVTMVYCSYMLVLQLLGLSLGMGTIDR